MLDLSRSSGAALAFKRQVQLLGNTPGARELQGIIDWLRASHIDPIFYSTQFVRYHSPAIRFTNKAAGLLAVCIDRSRAEYLLLFKSPMEHGVPDMAQASAGDPHGPATVLSQPWTQGEIAMAMDLRAQLQHLHRSIVRHQLIRSDKDE